MHIKNELKASQKERRILDDSRVDYDLHLKLRNYLSKDLDREDSKNGVLKLGHKRRKSEDVRKTERTEVKKKDGEKEKNWKKSLLMTHNKSIGHK